LYRVTARTTSAEVEPRPARSVPRRRQDPEKAEEPAPRPHHGWYDE